MPCADPIPDSEERSLNERISRNNHAASQIMCKALESWIKAKVELTEEEEAWLHEHRAIDAERKRLQERGSFYFPKTND